MTQLADLSDVIAITGNRALDATNTLRLIEMASALVIRDTGQTFEYVASDEIEVAPDMYGKLRLPQVPVLDVISIEVDGETVDADSYEWTAQGVIRRTDLRWTIPATVTYEHGYVEMPADVAMVVAEMVAGVLTVPSGVRSAQVDDVSITYSADAAPGLRVTDDHRAILRAFVPPAAPIPQQVSA